VILYTDGACSCNPGPGGWAYILKDLCSGRELERHSGLEVATTNNRMELLAVIRGLEAVPEGGAGVTVVTDSAYVGKGMTEWMPSWKRNGWQRKDGYRMKPIKNADLWQQLDELLQHRGVAVQIIKGHAGHPENEECDRMAVAEYLALRS
jgi:ribonuclease HI